MKSRPSSYLARVLPTHGAVLALGLFLASPLWGTSRTPAMAKRAGGAIYYTAPIVQGDPNNLYSLTDDVLSFGRGTQIAGNFYTHLDTDQGSIYLWWTPEFGSDALSGPGDHYLWYINSGYFLAYEYDTDRYNLTIGGQTLTKSTSITEGATYVLVARWDTRNTLDGTNYVCLSIDDVHTFGVTTPPTPSAPGADVYVGSDGSTGAASGIIEGLAIYRRPIYDGTFGIDVGNGDEINQLGSRDNVLLTGSWDVVFDLPTNASRGLLSSGTGEAWTHPFSSNLLPGNGNLGGLMLAGTAATDGWSNEATPTSVSALASSEKIFAGGYKFTVDAANEGLYQDATVSAGDDWVVRALAHSDGTCQPRIILYDQTNGAPIGSLTGTTTSTRTAPDVFVLTGEVPSGSTTLRVKLVNTASSGTCYWHQVEVLANLLTNPSMETGTGDPWIPTGWSPDQGIDASGESAQDTTTVHSGTSSLRVSAPADTRANSFRQAHADVVEDDFYMFGAFLYSTSGQLPQIYASNGRLVRQINLDTKVNATVFSTGVWEHLVQVGRRDDDSTSSNNDEVHCGPNSSNATNYNVDDAYIIHLTNVDLTVTPASNDDSTENTDELRVDGRDVYVATQVTGLGTTSGTLAFDWRPRHDAPRGDDFSETDRPGGDAYIVTLFGDADDSIEIFWDASSTIRMTYSMAGSTDTGTWICLGDILENTQYAVQVDYTGGGSMTLKVGGTTRITLTSIPASFGTAPDTVYYGSDSAGANQSDATFSNTPTAVRLASFEATGMDQAVELSWQTASEWNNLGFRLYRALSESGPYELITPTPIPGLGTSPEGATYRYRDTGLTNGIHYFYKLEDIDASGQTELRGPAWAIPGPLTSGAPEELPTVPTITFGDPHRSSFRVLSEGRRELVLELSTGGFHAEPREDGSLRLSIPGFEETEASNGIAVPVRRSWVEVIAGWKVELASASASDLVRISGVRLTEAASPVVIADARGTVKLGESRGRRTPSENESSMLWARLLGTGFQGDVKKALVELAPVRWNASTSELLLARRLIVRLVYAGREAGETARGRRHRESASHESRPVRAQLLVRESGLHAVRFEEALARSERGVPAESVRLSRLGNPVSFHLEPERNLFAPGSVLFFIGDGAEANPYGAETVYELEIGGTRSPMPVLGPDPSRGVPVHYFWQEVSQEVNRYYQAALVDAPDPWLWDVLFAPVVKTYELDVRDLAESVEPARLSVWVQGASEGEGSPDHHVRVSVNGSPVGEVRFDGKASQRLEAELAGVLREGSNVLAVENVGDTDAAFSMVFLDRFTVTYPRSLVAEGGNLEGSFSRSGIAEVSGLGKSAYVVDVTEEPPRWLRPEPGSRGTLRFRVEAGHRYRATSAALVLRPEIRKPRMSRWKDSRNAYDYLVVAPESFLAAAQPLVDLRRGQGLRPAAVALEEVYAEFGFGESRPEAIRELVSYAYHHWRVPPRYVLLLGDATYDFKDYLGTGVLNRVPPFMRKTTYLWTASDPAYASVNGEDVLPDVAIGRLPAATVEEAQAMVNKIVSHETAPSRWAGPVVLVADNPDRAGDFVANAEEIATRIPANKEIRKVYLSELGPAATRESIEQAFNEGASLLSYVGHGGIQLWADENVFDIGRVSSLGAQSQQALLLTMNCLNGYFHFPYFNSLSEELLKAQDKGVIAAFSPSGMSLDGPAHGFHQALVEELFQGGHERLGDVILAAQTTYAASGAFPELLSIYHLLGDPATTLR